MQVLRLIYVMILLCIFVLAGFSTFAKSGSPRTCLSLWILFLFVFFLQVTLF